LINYKQVRETSFKKIAVKSWDEVLDYWIFVSTLVLTLTLALYFIRYFLLLALNLFHGEWLIFFSIVFLLIEVVLVIFAIECIILCSILLHEKKRISILDVIQDSYEKYYRFLPTILLFIVVSAVSLILFVIPAFFVVPKYSLSLVICLRESNDPVRALKRSAKLTRGNFPASFWVVITSAILFLVIRIPIVGWLFGVFFAVPFIANTLVLLYYELKKTYV